MDVRQQGHNPELPSSREEGSISTNSGDIHSYGGVQGGAHNYGGVIGDVRNTYYLNNDDERYNVSTMGESPYPGMRWYTEPDKFAGHDYGIHEAAARLGVPSDKYPRLVPSRKAILFITGASGCGKSSFARAGLLPRLQRYYNEKVKFRRAEVTALTPGERPLISLFTALCELGVINDLEMTEEVFINLCADPAAFWQLVAKNTPNPQLDPSKSEWQINIILIDQFEEIFTIALPEQRKQLLDILDDIPPFAQCRTHMVINLREDYLHAAVLRLYRTLPYLIENGVRLTGLQKSELADAIQKPVIRLEKGKEVELSLVSILSEQVIPGLQTAAPDEIPRSDPRFLPLMQVTLEGLWNIGWMRHGTYKENYQEDIAFALQSYATRALHYKNGDERQPRSPDEQQAIMEMLLELVQLNLDDARLDACRPRLRSDMLEGTPNRERLLNELINSRLVIVSKWGEDVVVELVHESLMLNWKKLREAIIHRREEQISAFNTGESHHG